MTSAELLEEITAQLGELEPQDVLRLRSRVARVAAMIDHEDPTYLRRLAAGLAAIGDTAAADAVIARVQEAGQ